jgi:hypothetical protein
MDFLQSLESVGEFKQGVKHIRKNMTDMNDSLQNIDKEYFDKAAKAIQLKE